MKAQSTVVRHSIGRPGFGAKLPSIIITFILIILACAVVFPLLIPWFSVFKTQLEFAYNPWTLPKQIHWDNFKEAWVAIDIGRGLLNTLYVCLGAVACTVPSAAMAGYIFARYRNRVTEVVFYLVMAGYFVPVQMCLIPLYQLVGSLGISDTLPSLFLPMTAFGIPFWTIIYRSFFTSLPGELAEAARIDGAGHFATFFRVMLPLARPATVLAILMVFMGSWNDYLLGLILLNNQKLFTMQLRVAQFLNAYGVDRMPRYSAALIIASAPTLILYIIGHRWIIQGTLAGALKA
ncbi:MAG TPA: carbohydrate ABC transporter permease [Firmicutes bacterium]|nr:carbohydrate ABC transporter permease [Bacillota bacterium]